MKEVNNNLKMDPANAADFAQLVKRLASRNLGPGPGNLNLVTASEEAGADFVLLQLRDALADAGFSPR